MNPQDLISQLKAQHRTLQADLNLALNESKTQALNTGNAVVSDLARFRNDLTEHLKLENGEFYPDYLDKKIKRGEEVESTKEFIKGMDEIGKIVMSFLDKYDTPEKVNISLVNFEKELLGIIGTLNIRVETEEEGVFGLYLLL